MMNKEPKTAEKLLGSMWKQFTACNDGAGAFVLWHETKEFYADDNALSLMGILRETASYEALLNIAECAELETDIDAPVKTILAETSDEDITVVFVIRREYVQPDGMDEIYPLVSQKKLLDIISESGEDSFLMLVKLEHVDYDRDEKAFTSSAVDAIKRACPYNAAMSYHSRQHYWVFAPHIKEPDKFAEKLQNAVKNCVIFDEFGVMISKLHNMTFTGGYVSFNGKEHTAIKEFHYASFALYEAVSCGVGTVSSFSRDIYEIQKNDYRRVQSFFNVIEKNDFLYHFQPIVNARDGSIFAYEALMRTDKKTGLNPLQILDMALKYDKLYDIEHSTMFNVLKGLSKNQSIFAQRKLFINAIPSSFLSDEDWDRLMDVYGELMEKVVIELTEQTDTSDENLSYLMKRLKDHKVQMAIDDYGTGYSNTSRLIKYDPDYIKLDHSLISGIDKNAKLQSIVSGLVDMMHSNGFMVLAEGIETSGEMKTLSLMNVDLYQGYYISRPKPFFINDISKKIKAEILRNEHEANETNKRIYHAVNDGSIELGKIEEDGYSGISVECSSLEIIGSPDNQRCRISITVKKHTKCSLTFTDVRLESDPDSPALGLEEGADVILCVNGDNRLIKGGILVPRSAGIEITGRGSLSIVPEAISCYGIGNEYGLEYGRIQLHMTGMLSITVCGEKCVGIGGGYCGGSPIEISGGNLDISLAGAQSIAIGSSEKWAEVHITDSHISIGTSSASFNGIGSVCGDSSMTIDNADIDIIAAGNSMCVIGSKEGGNSRIAVSDSRIKTHIKGRNVVMIGTSGSNTVCSIIKSHLSLKSEGECVSGIGDSNGSGSVQITDSDVEIYFLSENYHIMGCKDGKLDFVGGSRKICINE